VFGARHRGGPVSSIPLGSMAITTQVGSLEAIESSLQGFLAPLHLGADTMHDATHIRRIASRALEFAELYPCNVEILRVAAQLHGVVNSHESAIRKFLTTHGVPMNEIDRVIEAARESEKESEPRTLEGKLLHDAHLLEGDENFIITKSLVTGSARGQTLAETVAYLETHLDAYHCCLPANQIEYERRLQIARRFVASLKPEL
jgi:uncharacterized protein